MSDCVFCRILLGELPSSGLYDDPLVSAFLDIMPVNPGHALVIPRRHAPNLADLSEEEVRHIAVVGQTVASALRTSLGCDGINWFLADGVVAGQEVFHAHLHVFPRHKNDGFGLKLPPSYGKVADRDSLDAMASAIRMFLKPLQL